MQKTIQQLKKFALFTLVCATIFWIMAAFQIPTMFFPTKERTVILNHPEFHLGKYYLFLTSQNEMKSDKKYRINCSLFESKGSKSFCDQYGYHMSLVKIFKVESILLYTSFLNTNDLIVTRMTFLDPYDGKTKVFHLSAQDIVDWRAFYTKRQRQSQILCITTLICWGVYIFYLLLKRKYKKIKAVNN
ncbi:hypothetical protein PT286_02320 [Neisseriaceae bacterium ESL0693]|nr:hypothetical protein [Neisseriaceae bacterium ESL0693]